jgi:hypothetical protein
MQLPHHKCLTASKACTRFDCSGSFQMAQPAAVIAAVLAAASLCVQGEACFVNAGSATGSTCCEGLRCGNVVAEGTRVPIGVCMK